MTIEPATSPSRASRSLAATFAIAFLTGIVAVVGLGGAGLYASGQPYTGKDGPRRDDQPPDEQGKLRRRKTYDSHDATITGILRKAKRSSKPAATASPSP